MTVKILIGDVRAMLATLPDESVHCVVTSPPYWNLRDYSIDGQIGQEPTLGEHVEVMVEVFREVRRVLRKDGTVWLNYGDCYAGSWGAQRHRESSTNGQRMSRNQIANHPKRASNTDSIRDAGLKPKDLCMMPARVALALQADGWWLRSEIIWHKPNPMPESTTDRPTSSHEKIYLLAKSPRYYYDAVAVREPVTGNAHARRSYKTPDGWDTSTGEGGHGSYHKNGREKGKKPGVPPKSAAPGSGIKANESFHEAVCDLVADRNLRNIWSIPSASFPGAHFATFPPALVEPCIKAGTSEKGCCPECGAPWLRETERQDQGWDGSRYGERAVAATGGAKSGGTAKSTLGSNNGKLTGKMATLGWRPSCDCGLVEGPCTVLDPFGGVGTTGMVADRLKRNAILIELNPEYAAMAEKRIQTDGGMFVEVT